MSQLPSTVEFVVPAENAHIVVMLLLSNEIAFTLTSLNKAENTQKTIAAPSDAAPSDTATSDAAPSDTATSDAVPSDTAPSEIPDPQKADFIYKAVKPLHPTVPVFESICLKYLIQQIEQLPPKDAQIAAEFGITAGSFKNGFRAVYGKSFYQLFIEQRIEHAKTLLLKGVKSSEIAERFGYSQSIKFNKIFYKYVGMTPRKFQLKHQERIRTRR